MPVGASSMRSPASSSRPATGCVWKTSPSPTSFATSTWPELSVTPAGQSSRVSFVTRPSGCAPSWWSVTAGTHRPRHARAVGRSRSRWGWANGSSVATAASWSWTGTATPPPTSPPGPSAIMPRSRTAKRAAGLRTPLEGKALTIVVAMVQPAPVKGEPTLTPSWREPGTPEKGAAGPPHREVVRQALELDPDRPPLLPTGLEVFTGPEAEHRREDALRHGADGVVVGQDRVVVVLPCVRGPVLGLRQLLLQRQEALVGLEVRVGLRHRKQALQGAAQHVLGRRLAGGSLRVDRPRPRLGDRLQRAPLMGGVALDGLDQVGDQVVTALELHVDLAPRVVDMVPPPNQAVVDQHGHDQQHDDDRHDDEGGGHGQSFHAPEGTTTPNRPSAWGPLPVQAEANSESGAGGSLTRCGSSAPRPPGRWSAPATPGRPPARPAARPGTPPRSTSP